MHTDIFQENLFFLIGKIGDLGFNLGAYCDHRSFFLSTDRFYFFKQGVVLETVFFYVGNVHDRFHRQETKLLDDGFFVLR